MSGGAVGSGYGKTPEVPVRKKLPEGCALLRRIAFLFRPAVGEAEQQEILRADKEEAFLFLLGQRHCGTDDAPSCLSGQFRPAAELLLRAGRGQNIPAVRFVGGSGPVHGERRVRAEDAVAFPAHGLRQFLLRHIREAAAFQPQSREGSAQKDLFSRKSLRGGAEKKGGTILFRRSRKKAVPEQFPVYGVCEKEALCAGDAHRGAGPVPYAVHHFLFSTSVTVTVRGSSPVTSTVRITYRSTPEAVSPPRA